MVKHVFRVLKPTVTLRMFLQYVFGFSIRHSYLEAEFFVGIRESEMYFKNSLKTLTITLQQMSNFVSYFFKLGWGGIMLDMSCDSSAVK